MQLTCPHCNYSKEISEQLLPQPGTPVNCPRCRGVFALPRTDQAAGQGAAPVAAKSEQQSPSELPKAGFWLRLVALLVDGLAVCAIQFGLGGLLLLTGLLTGSADSEAMGPLVLLIQFFTSVIGFTYYVFFTGYCGQTPGKMLVRVKVIRCDGAPISYRRACFRELPGKFVSAIIFGIGYLMAAFDDQKQALHDRIADTYVVKL